MDNVRAAPPGATYHVNVISLLFKTGLMEISMALSHSELGLSQVWIMEPHKRHMLSSITDVPSVHGLNRSGKKVRS